MKSGKNRTLKTAGCATRELCLSLWQYFRAMADPSIQESQLSARPWMAAGGFQFGLEEIADLAKRQQTIRLTIRLIKGKSYSELVFFCSHMVLSGSRRQVFLLSFR